MQLSKDASFLAIAVITFFSYFSQFLCHRVIHSDISPTVFAHLDDDVVVKAPATVRWFMHVVHAMENDSSEIVFQALENRATGIPELSCKIVVGFEPITL